MSWLTNWAYRTEITVDNTNIDSDLTHFPVPIVLGISVGQSNQDLSGVFDELGASSKKIAITKADGTTQLYGEVEQWDNVNKKALIWVSKFDLTLTSASTTTLYLYYDSTKSDNITYVGDASDSAAQNVWKYLSFYTMAQDPSGGVGCMLDSTSNTNHGTPGGTMTSGDLITTDFDLATDFDAVDDHVQIFASEVVPAGFRALGSDGDSFSIFYRLHESGASVDPPHYWFPATLVFELRQQQDAGCHVPFSCGFDPTGHVAIGRSANYISASDRVQGTVIVTDGAEHFVQVDVNNDAVDIYVDGSLDVSASFLTTADTSVSTATSNMGIACRFSDDGHVDRSYQYGGKIFNIGLHDATLGAAWAKANYHAQSDNFLTFDVSPNPYVYNPYNPYADCGDTCATFDETDPYDVDTYTPSALFGDCGDTCATFDPTDPYEVSGL